MTTNTVKHTPGPWFVGGVRQKVDGQEALGIFRYDEAKKRDLNIASVWYDRRDGAGTNDARLIAAAPDLLAALRKLELAVLHNGDWDDGCFYHNGTSAPELQSPLDAARAAISKATGA